MIEYTIQDMTCGSCARRITQAIVEFDPEAEVEIDIQTRRVSVVSELRPETLTDQIIAAGYTPVPVVKVSP